MLKKALVLGATGLVGKTLVRLLCADDRYDTIVCLIRKPLPKHYFFVESQKLQLIVVDFNELDEYQGYFYNTHTYVCLGTTIKKAGTKAGFRKVDFEYVHAAAQLARKAQSFVWISSVGANANSGNFYLKVKGELENAILGMSQLKHASAVRPSLLLGERQESRPLETISLFVSGILSPLFMGKLAKYKPVQARDVAKKMIRLQVF